MHFIAPYISKMLKSQQKHSGYYVDLFYINICSWRLRKALEGKCLRSTLQQTLSAGTSSVKDAGLLSHLRNVLQRSPGLKTPCLPLFTLGP